MDVKELVAAIDEFWDYVNHPSVKREISAETVAVAIKAMEKELKKEADKVEVQNALRLEDLQGEHILSAVDTGFDGDASMFLFELDGVTYCAKEDPKDGYRSCMEELYICDQEPKTKIPPTKIVCIIDDGDSDILTGIDIKNGRRIFQVGTDYWDDYYPSFVARWMPENLSINTGR